MKGTVLITGVSSGIGLATARGLVAAGYQIIGSVRNEEDAARVTADLGCSFLPILLDVTRDDSVSSGVTEVARITSERGLQGLINNAGIVVAGRLLDLESADLDRQFEVNFFGMLRVTRACLPLLRPGSTGRTARIINLSSVSGRVTYPLLGAYAASKHAVEAASDAMRRELPDGEIDVIVVAPGTVDTPLLDKAKAQLASGFERSDPDLLRRLLRSIDRKRAAGLRADHIARVIETALEETRPRTRYVVPRSWLRGWYLPRLLPDRWMDRATKRTLAGFWGEQ